MTHILSVAVGTKVVLTAEILQDVLLSKVTFYKTNTSHSQLLFMVKRSVKKK